MIYFDYMATQLNKAQLLILFYFILFLPLIIGEMCLGLLVLFLIAPFVM